MELRVFLKSATAPHCFYWTHARSHNLLDRAKKDTINQK